MKKSTLFAIMIMAIVPLTQGCTKEAVSPDGHKLGISIIAEIKDTLPEREKKQVEKLEKSRLAKKVKESGNKAKDFVDYWLSEDTESNDK